MQKIFGNKLYFLYMASFIFLLLIWFQRPFSYNDFYLHTVMGQWMIDHMEIPRIAINSWYGEEQNLPWIAHEWASEVVMAFYYSMVGHNKIILVFSCLALCIGATWAIIWFNRKDIEKNYLSSAFIIFSIAISFSSFFCYRPQVFSYLFFFIEMYLLLKVYETENKKYLYPIPFLSILWANFHGGSSALVYVLPILLVVFQNISVRFLGLEERFFSKKIPSNLSKNMLFTSVLSVLCLSINPNGFSMILYPYINMMDANMLKYILEWQPLNLKEFSHLYLCFFPLLAVWFSLFISQKKINFVDFMFLFVFTFMTFKSARFIMYFDIYAGLVAFKYLQSDSWEIYNTTKDIVKHNLKLTMFSVLAVFVSCIYITYQSDGILKQEDLAVIHKDLFNFMKENHYNYHVWNRDTTGNEMLVHGIKTFTDGRADAYTGEPFAVSVPTMFPYMDYEKMIEKYDFHYVIIYDGDPLMVYIKNHPERFTLLFKEEGFHIPESFTETTYDSLYKINR